MQDTARIEKSIIIDLPAVAPGLDRGLVFEGKQHEGSCNTCNLTFMHKGDDQAQIKEPSSSSTTATPSVFNLDDVLKPSETFDFLDVKTTEKVDTTPTTEPTTQQGKMSGVGDDDVSGQRG